MGEIEMGYEKGVDVGTTVYKLEENMKRWMDDPDIIHVDNSFDLALATTLNDLKISALHINGQSIDVDAPPDIIDVDEDDDIINDEDILPHDLADSDNEDLVNVDDDDGVAVMSADVARGHGGDDGGDDRPDPHESAEGCRGKGTRKPNLGGRKAGRMHTRKETWNLGLRKITDKLGPQPIQFEWKDNGTMLPLGDHSAHWANLLGEIVREFPMHFGSWRSSRQSGRRVIRTFTTLENLEFLDKNLWDKLENEFGSL
nr:anaphase-promoting complex/cyclosome 2 [Tanacetum cinerariifolium]